MADKCDCCGGEAQVYGYGQTLDDKKTREMQLCNACVRRKVDIAEVYGQDRLVAFIGSGNRQVPSRPCLNDYEECSV